MGLAEADALVAAPWFGFGGVVDFDAARLARAPRLKAIAGTFDYRLGWVDLDEAARRGVTVVDTSRTMTWTVAEFGVAITLALLRDIPRSIDARAGRRMAGLRPHGQRVRLPRPRRLPRGAGGVRQHQPAHPLVRRDPTGAR